jgi:hypothetical protein
MAALDGTERILFPKKYGKHQQDYANHQTEGDRWIEAGAEGLRALAHG